MKKLIAALLLVTLLIPGLSANAEKRELIEFTQRYQKALETMRLEYDFPVVSTISKALLQNFDSKYTYHGDGLRQIIYSDGIAMVYMEDFSIISIELSDYIVKSGGNIEAKTAELVAFVNALEFSAMEEFMFGGSQSSTLHKATDIVANQMKFTTTAYGLAEKGREVLIYTGKYKYYLTYDEIPANGKTFYCYSITAKNFD